MAVSILHQNIHRQSLVGRPDFCAENFHGLAANAISPPVSRDEKLPQINFLRLLAIQGIRDNCPVVFKNHRGVFGRQPAAHPLFQFGNGHIPIPMTFVVEQLMIQFREQGGIIDYGAAEVHLHSFA